MIIQQLPITSSSFTVLRVKAIMESHSMSYFRQPKKRKSMPKTTDGFITRTSTSRRPNVNEDVRVKFRTTYKPEVEPDAEGFKISSAKEGFANRQQDSIFSEGLSIKDKLQPESGSSPDQFEEAPKHRWVLPRFHRKSKKFRKKKSIFSRFVRSFAILTVALVIGVTSLFTYGYIKTRNVFKGGGEGAAALQKNVDPVRLNGEGDGRINILLIGKGGPGHAGPDLTDTMLLASIDPIKNEAALISIPRDLYVRDSSGYSTKLNAIYSNAKSARLRKSNKNNSDRQAAEDIGLSALKRKISDVLGIPVHYYVMVDFKGFEEAINTVGGITVDVKKPLYDQTMAWLLGGNPLIAGKGLQTFNGRRALLYARSRHGSARGDFDRTERQRGIIVALLNKVLSLGTFSNPFKIVDLLNTFGGNVRTDLNGLGEIKRLYEIGQNIGANSISSIGLADPPNVLVRTDNIRGLSIVEPTAGLYQYDEIHSFIRNNVRDAFLANENAKIVILNGTSIAGLATATSRELQSYGYDVAKVDNAPTKTYIHSLLIDLSSGKNKYTKSYLERRLGLKVTTQKIDGLPGSNTADFVIILGTDEASKKTN